MVAAANDIVMVLTGGSSNTNPNLSIGGNPSNQPITGTQDNLFDDITQNESQAGLTDYRCVYIFNNNSTDSLYDLNFWGDEVAGTESTIQLGLLTAVEIQQIQILGNATGGSFNISYNPPTQNTTVIQTILYDPNPTTWGNNLQVALNSIPTFSGIVVSVLGTFGSRTFNITFAGTDDLRSHDLIGLDITNLTGGSITGSVAKLVSGSPINSLPALLDVSTTPPAGVLFSTSSSLSPIHIGTLYPEEGFPVWFQRTVSPGESPVAGEGLTLRISMTPIGP